jgi:ribosomal protein L40E
MKNCPYCTSEIPFEAKKCKFCGEWVEPTDTFVSQLANTKLVVKPPTHGDQIKPCPHCRAEIPEDAWTCMYCQSGVLGGRPLSIAVPVVFLLIFAIFFFCFWLPGFLDMQKKHHGRNDNSLTLNHDEIFNRHLSKK